MCFYNGIVSTASTFRKAALNRKLNSTALEKESPELGELKQGTRGLPGMCQASASPPVCWHGKEGVMLSCQKPKL